ncbi:hypothetical protein J6590_091787 [Homalodisca vitripennis]|nr:hypothetical protein J6590_091787 [Homalodisca vitripennis]
MTRDELLYYSSLSDLDLSAYFCRQTPRGGAAVYVRNSLKCTPLDLERYSEVQQAEFADTIVNKVSLVVLAMYRSPLGQVARFLYLLELCLGFLVTLGLSVVIGSVSEPTRGAASLDSFLTNIDKWSYDVLISESQIADHKHVFFTLKHWRPQVIDSASGPSIKTVTIISFNDTNFQWFVETVAVQTPDLADLIGIVCDMSKSRSNLKPWVQHLRREYRAKVMEAKQAAVGNFIAQSQNPCKAAWDYINRSKHRVSAPDTNFATAEVFNEYFLNSAKDLFNSSHLSLVTLPSGNGDAYLSSVPVVPFNFAWKLVAVEEVIKVVHGFKSSKSKDIYDMGGNASESDTVQNLRKMLRSLLKLNIRANAGNLKGRIEPSIALKETKVDLKALSVKIGNLSEEKSTGDYLRLVCRHKHLTVRFDVLCELYKWEGASETLISKLKDGLIEIKAKLGKLGVSEEEIVNFETSLLNTSLEEEEVEEISKPVVQTRNEDILGLSLPPGDTCRREFCKIAKSPRAI